jgi:hypothetical protein
MNLFETRLLLSEAWTLYPSAPRLTPEEKKLTAISWFRTLYEYSYQDARAAFRRAAKKTPRFMPSAFEVLDECVETYDIDDFLTPYEKTLSTRKFEYTQKFSDVPILEIACLKSARDHAKDNDERTELTKEIVENVKAYNLEQQLFRAREAAQSNALRFYHQRESMKAAADFATFCSLEKLSLDADFEKE